MKQQQHLNRAGSYGRFVLVGLLTLVFSQLAFAAKLEEVVVTAQKRQQNIQDVGIAVTAFSARQIQDFGFLKATDIVNQTPGLSMATPFGDGNNAAFTLRGVGLNDFSEHNESPVAVYVDDVYQATLAAVNFQMFDLERVEVLKGPQGTLFGRNSTGGLVHFITRKPSDNFNGYLQATGGSYNQIRVEGAVGGPLTKDLDGRLSFVYHDHDGYRPTTTPGIKDANSMHTAAVRGQLLFQPTSRIQILGKMHYEHADQVAATYTDAVTTFAPDGITAVAVPANQVNPICAYVIGLQPPGQDCYGYRDMHKSPWTTDNNRQPFLKLDAAGGSVKVDWQLNPFTITSITAYEYLHKYSGEDTDMGPSPAIAVSNPVNSEQATQEFRLAGQTDRFRWNTGFFYFYRDIRTGSRTDLSGIDFVNDNTRDRLLTNSWALFGHAEYDLAPKWTVVGGLRYTYEKDHFQMIAVDDLGNTPVFLGLSSVPIPGYVLFNFTDQAVGNKLTHQKGHSVSFRAELDWRPKQDWLVYGAISRGVKGFVFNFAIDGTGVFGASTVDSIPVREEKLLSYELGFKSTMFNDTTRFNAALFYYDYNNFQAFSFVQLANQITNKDATLYGFDADLVTKPWDGWTFRFGLSLLHTKVKDVKNADFFTGAIVTRNRHMVLAPDVKFTGLARYEWPMFNGTMSIQGDFYYVGKQYFDLNNDPIATEQPYVIGDARLAYSGPGDKYEIALSVKNIADTPYRVYEVPVPSAGITQQMYNVPRWVSGTITYRF